MTVNLDNAVAEKIHMIADVVDKMKHSTKLAVEIRDKCDNPEIKNQLLGLKVYADSIVVNRPEFAKDLVYITMWGLYTERAQYGPHYPQRGFKTGWRIGNFLFHTLPAIGIGFL